MKPLRKSQILLNLDVLSNLSGVDYKQNKTPKKSILLINAARKSLKISGCYPQEIFPKISQISSSSRIKIDLCFDMVNDRPILTGTLTVKLSIICQRCMDIMDFSANIAVNLLFINEKTQQESIEERLALDVEIFPLNDNELDLVDIISDEILLALPMSPKHKKNCLEYKD